MLTTEDLIRAYRGLPEGTPVHINPGHAEALERVAEAVREEKTS